MNETGIIRDLPAAQFLDGLKRSYTYLNYDQFCALLDIKADDPYAIDKWQKFHAMVQGLRAFGWNWLALLVSGVPEHPERHEEQAIACLNCSSSELIRDDSPRLPDGKWPAWEPGLQEFPCPQCGAVMVWATEPRDTVTAVQA